MRFGHFDDEAREYVITTPHTPYPWINYLGSQEFFSLISHQAGGYSFYRDARMRRLTRYRYNNVPTDTGGRYLYVNDGGAVGTPWTTRPTTSATSPSARSRWRWTPRTGARSTTRPSTASVATTTPCTPSTCALRGSTRTARRSPASSTGCTSRRCRCPASPGTRSPTAGTRWAP